MEGGKTRESIENTLGEKRGTINKLNQVRSRNLTWATADEGDGCQLRNPCSLHELPDCIRGSDCIMRWIRSQKSWCVYFSHQLLNVEIVMKTLYFKNYGILIAF